MWVLFSPWWPFLVLAFVGVVLGCLAYFDSRWREKPLTGVQIAAALVTSAAAVSIPLVLQRDARDTRTLELVNEVSRKIAEAVSRKDELDIKNGKSESDRYGYDYVSSDRNVSQAVFQILNEYEYICLGANQNLFSNVIIRSLRWDALDQTWRDYSGYIAQHRRGGGSKAEAWIQCERWLKENPRVRVP